MKCRAILVLFFFSFFTTAFWFLGLLILLILAPYILLACGPLNFMIIIFVYLFHNSIILKIFHSRTCNFIILSIEWYIILLFLSFFF